MTYYVELVHRIRIVIAILVAIGLLGNILTIVILCRRSLRSQMTTKYLQLLVTSDLIVLCTSIVRYRVYLLNLDEIDYLKVTFQIEPYLSVYINPIHWMSLGITSLVILALTFQRYIAVKSPFYSRSFSKYNHLCIVTFVIGIPSILTFPNWIAYDLKTWDFPIIGKLVIANLKDDLKSYICAFHSFILPIIWYIIPWIVVAITNILLVRQLRIATKVRIAIVSSTHAARANSHNRSLTILLIAIVMIYMLLNLPKCILVIAGWSRKKDPCLQADNQIPSNIWEVAELIASVFNISNSSVNFVMYCLFSDNFRAEIIKIFQYSWPSKNKVIRIVITRVHG